MKQRKPRQHQPTVVTPEDEQEWLQALEDADASNALAQERYYALRAWDDEQHEQARKACQRAQGVL